MKEDNDALAPAAAAAATSLPPSAACPRPRPALATLGITSDATDMRENAGALGNYEVAVPMASGWAVLEWS